MRDYDELMAQADELERQADRLEADDRARIRFREALAKLREIAERQAQRSAS